MLLLKQFLLKQSLEEGAFDTELASGCCWHRHYHSGCRRVFLSRLEIDMRKVLSMCKFPQDCSGFQYGTLGIVNMQPTFRSNFRGPPVLDYLLSFNSAVSTSGEFFFPLVPLRDSHLHVVSLQIILSELDSPPTPSEIRRLRQED